jgi:hypothetical protein
MAVIAEVVKSDNKKQYVSEEDYWNFYYEDEPNYEWNNGYLEEKPVSDYQTVQVYMWLVELLQRFLSENPIAHVTALEMGFRLALPNKVTIRKPDLGIVRLDNPVPLKLTDCTFHGIFDLCIEALSDKKLKYVHRDTVTKKEEYLAVGVPEYYILHNEVQRCVFYARNQQGVYRPIVPQHGVINSNVLPGFRFRLRDLETKPDMRDLMHDPVYKDFVFLNWQRERQQAALEIYQAELKIHQTESELQQAKLETKQVKSELQQAELKIHQTKSELQQSLLQKERLAAQLRALGIDPDIL